MALAKQVVVITCGFCWHPGPHATITRGDGTKVCTGCAICQDERSRERRIERRGQGFTWVCGDQEGSYYSTKHGAKEGLERHLTEDVHPH
jgi:hypothetical protein